MEKPKTLRRMLNKKRLKKKKRNRISNLRKALRFWNLKRETTRKSQRWTVRMKKLKSWQQWVYL